MDSLFETTDVFMETEPLIAPTPAAERNPQEITWADIEEEFTLFWNGICNAPTGALLTAEQGGQVWHAGRAFRLTASNFGAASDLNPYCSANDLLQRMLYPSFVSNAACQWGNDHEPVACAKYVEETTTLDPDCGINHLNSGIHINPRYPFLGASPDGLVTVDRPITTAPLCLQCPVDPKYDLIETVFDPEQGMISRVLWEYPPPVRHTFLSEFKCPFRKCLYPSIPNMYYCQIQGCMSVIDLPYSHFYVWTPTKTSLMCYPANEKFWREFLYPKLRDFYFNRFLPFAFLKHMGFLQPGTLVSTMSRPVCQQLVAASRALAAQYPV